MGMDEDIWSDNLGNRNEHVLSICSFPAGWTGIYSIPGCDVCAQTASRGVIGDFVGITAAPRAVIFVVAVEKLNLLRQSLSCE